MNQQLRSWLATLCIVFLISTTLVGGTAAAHEEHDHGPDCPQPGFVSGLVQDVTPDFLADLIGSLPVPDFVKDIFGAGQNC